MEGQAASVATRVGDDRMNVATIIVDSSRPSQCLPAEMWLGWLDPPVAAYISVDVISYFPG
jgi:hypothetical protein